MKNQNCFPDADTFVRRYKDILIGELSTDLIEITGQELANSLANNCNRTESEIDQARRSATHHYLKLFCDTKPSDTHLTRECQYALDKVWIREYDPMTRYALRKISMQQEQKD